jgi:hypothetical protein
VGAIPAGEVHHQQGITTARLLLFEGSGFDAEDPDENPSPRFAITTVESSTVCIEAWAGNQRSRFHHHGAAVQGSVAAVASRVEGETPSTVDPVINGSDQIGVGAWTL